MTQYFKLKANKKCLSAKSRRWLRRIAKKLNTKMDSPEFKESMRKCYIDLATYGQTEINIAESYGTAPIETINSSIFPKD